jgi:hypothetical protein
MSANGTPADKTSADVQPNALQAPVDGAPGVPALEPIADSPETLEAKAPENG